MNRVTQITFNLEDGRVAVINTEELVDGTITISRDIPEILPWELNYPIPEPKWTMITVNFSFLIDDRKLLQKDHLIGEVINQEKEKSNE